MCCFYEDMISCITPTYNRAEYLIKAIESTLVQTYKNWEMIIIDDHSTDDTEHVVHRYMQKDKRIKYYKNPGKGASAARNFGINIAKGEWIAFLDDDVENLPQRFEKQLLAAKTLNSGFIVSGFFNRNSKGKLKTCLDRWWGEGAPMTSCWFIKKELLLKAGLFDENMPSMEDPELSYRIAKHEIFSNLLIPLTIENQLPNSLSKGLKGIQGKEMLLRKQGSNMHKHEAAWWHFILGINYYTLKRKRSALYHFEKASEKRKSILYKLVCIYLKNAYRFNIEFHKINILIFTIINRIVKIRIVNHPVIYNI